LSEAVLLFWAKFCHLATQKKKGGYEPCKGFIWGKKWHEVTIFGGKKKLNSLDLNHSS
jgi:hypothetical protein